MKITYDRNRFPKRQKREDGTWGCRGCGGEIPKGRRTWCSRECDQRFNPASVLIEVRKRDNGVCAICGLDSKEQKKRWMSEKPDYIKTGWESHQRWLRDCPKINYDHIVPFSEGGMTVLENMRTLCEPCHKKRTKEWHKQRKNNGQEVLPLTDAYNPQKEELTTDAPFT